MHLVEGRQVLFGEWPVRDYFDFGLPLQVLTSTVTLMARATTCMAKRWSPCVHRGRRRVHVRRRRPLVALADDRRRRRRASPRWLLHASTTTRKLSSTCARCGRPGRYAQRPDHATAGGARLARSRWRSSTATIMASTSASSSIVLFLVMHWGEPRAGADRVRAATRGVILLLVAPFLLFVQVTIGLPVVRLRIWCRARRRRSRAHSLRCRSRSIVQRPGDGRPAGGTSLQRPLARDAGRADAGGARSRISAEPSAAGGAGDVELCHRRRRARRTSGRSSTIRRSSIRAESTARAGVLAVRELWYEWLQRRVPVLRMQLSAGAVPSTPTRCRSSTTSPSRSR